MQESELSMRFYICSLATGQRLSDKFRTSAEAEAAMTTWQKDVPLTVSGGLPWEIAPSAWNRFETASTVQDLVQAVLSFPGDWDGVSRAFSYHPLAERFSAVTGIAYCDYYTVEHGMVVRNPKSKRGGTCDLFVWDHTTGLAVKGVSKNGLQWDTTKYSGKVTPRQLYYIREDDGKIGLRLEKPQDGDGLTPVTLKGNNLPEPFAKGSTSSYGSVTPMMRIDQDLNERWPLKWGFRWVNGEPSANVAENYFATLKERPEQLWLLPNNCYEAVEIGKKIRCRERGGIQTVEVKEIARNSTHVWVRGTWSDGSYLPVNEFLSGMPSLEDLAAHRKIGDPEFQGSLR